MKARIPVAAASAVIALVCVPFVSDASRIPSRPLQPPEESYVISESDPWIPDNREPARMLQAPPMTDAVAPDTDVPLSPSIAARHTWQFHMLRLMRILRLGGILR